MKNLVLILVMFTWLGCSSGQSRSNVVLIIIDTLRADKVGAYGFPANISPDLDTLANDGIKFERVLTQASWTRPSIGSMLTSQYPRTLGLYQEQWDVLPNDAITAAEIFKEAGFATVGITANPNINTSFGFGQGFDTYINSEVLFHWMDAESHREDESGQSSSYRNGHLIDKKKIAVSASNFEKIRMPARDVFRVALTEINKLKQRPFYLQINIMDVHGGHKIPASEVDQDLRDLKDPGYLQSVRIASAEVGKFVAEVKRLTKQQTLFIITSDHGEGLKDHPGVPNSSGHGKYLYESVLAVPLIIAGNLTGIKTKVVKQQIRMLDMLPTVLDLVGIKGPHFEGVSLKPIINGSVNAVPLPLSYSETHMRGANKIAIHSEEWGFIENRDGWRWLDPKELQRAGGGERGRQTNQFLLQPELSQDLAEELGSWDTGYTSRPPSAAATSELTASEIERLRSLGYIK